MANITVLFGAGAECQFNLSGGEDFSKNVLGINKPNLNLAVEKYYVEKHFENLNKWFPPYQKTQWKTYDLFKASVKKYLIDKEIDIPSAQNFDLQLRKEIRRIKGEEKKNIKNKYPSYMGLLDEQFHALIAPCALGADKFWNVVACYTRAYLTLTAQIIFSAKRTISVNDYLCLLNDPQKAIRSIRATCSSDTRFHGESYYSILKKHSDLPVLFLFKNSA